MADQDWTSNEEIAKRRVWFDEWDARVDRIHTMHTEQIRDEIRVVSSTIRSVVDPFNDRDDAEWHSYEWSVNRWVWYALAAEEAFLERAGAIELDLRGPDFGDEFKQFERDVAHMKELFFGFTRGLNRPTADHLEHVAQGRIELVRPTERVIAWLGAPRPFEDGEDPDRQ